MALTSSTGKTRVISSADRDPQYQDCTSNATNLSVKSQDRYKFIRSIGFGGMKGVLLVYDRDTCREVAMAIMPDFKERSQEDISRFIIEAKLTAQLEHPNIVPIHDIGLDQQGAPYYTMTYLRGSSLELILKRLRKKDEATLRTYTLERRLQIFLRICNAVNYAHSQHICHLDLKPSNINIGEFGEVMLLDWGLACQTDAQGRAKLIPGYQVKGTPGYMAPEQINPESGEVGIASDIYSLGALLYAMLALHSPANDQPEIDVLRQTLNGTFPRPAKVAPAGMRIPAALEKICLKAMAANPHLRYSTVSELRHEIINFHNNILTSWMLWTRPRRRRALFVILLLYVLVVIFNSLLNNDYFNFFCK